MKWPRTPSGWERSEKVLALCIAALVPAGALAPFIGWVAIPAALAIVTVVGVVWRLWIAMRKATLEENLEEAKLDRRLRIAIQKVGSADPRQIGVDPATQDLLPGGEIPKYLPRTKDQEVRQALADAFSGQGRWIVAVCGSSKTGKSRLLFEAIKWYGEQSHNAYLIAPKDGAALKSLIEPNQLPSHLADKNLIVWLDDLETFVAEGVDLDVLQEWQERNGIVFAATYGGKGSERVREASDTGLSVLSETLLQHSKQIGLSRTDANELEALPKNVPESLREEIERHGLPAVMVSGPALERKLMTGRHALGDSECLSGVAITRAAVDWARCGRTDPISAEDLEDLWQNYLPAGVQASDEQFETGLEWALRPVSGTIALLHHAGGYLAYDYVVSLVDKQGPPHEAAWASTLQNPDPGQAFSVGVRANQHGRSQDAEAAMRIAGNSSDARLVLAANHNLGVVLKEQGRIEEAEEALKRADAGGLGVSASNLGFLLQAKGDIKGAEAAFRRAADRGSGSGAFNLGLVLLQRDDLAGAEKAFQRAHELGDKDALNNLGALLDQKGDRVGAEKAFREAGESGNRDAEFNLGLMLEEKGDDEHARMCFQRVIDGHSDRLSALAKSRLEKGS
ncbi:MAG: tetratricopeptide repeat protein [Solirubrobacterales bacterium]